MWKCSGHGNPPPRPLTTKSIRALWLYCTPPTPHTGSLQPMTVQWGCLADLSLRNTGLLPAACNTPIQFYTLSCTWGQICITAWQLPQPSPTLFPISVSPAFPQAKSLHIEPILASTPLRIQTNTTMLISIQSWKLCFDQLNIQRQS